MDRERNWQGDDGIIRLWEYLGIAHLPQALTETVNRQVSNRAIWADGYEPPVSLDDYLVERHRQATATSSDALTVRQALMALGLTQRAHRYPEWVCAEAWLFVALQIEQQIAAVAILARAHDLGLSQSSIEQARVRLGVVSTRRSGSRHSGWRWQLPPTLNENSNPGDVDPRWRRFQQRLPGH